MHERVLRLIYNYKSSSYRERFERNELLTIHERNIQILLAEIFQVKTRVATEIITEIFKFKDHSYNLRRSNCIEWRIIKSCKYGSETVFSVGAKLWKILPKKY